MSFIDTLIWETSSDMASINNDSEEGIFLAFSA